MIKLHKIKYKRFLRTTTEKELLEFPSKSNKNPWVGMQERRSAVGVRQQILVCLGLFLFGYMILLQTDLDTHQHLFIPHYGSSDNEGGLDVATKGCSIPALDPWDLTVQKYAKESEPPVQCKRHADYVIQEGDTLRLMSNATCCFTPFYRITTSAKNYGSSVGCQYRYASYCTPISGTIDVGNEEFVRVTCKDEDATFSDYFAFAPRNLHEKGNTPNQLRNLSVLLIGLDGLSRLNFIRTMPRSHAFFSTRSSFEMLGFNKVGDNTFPNLLPVLMGQTEEEVKQSCWPTTNQVFDNCHFIWDDFKKAGFMTAFAEDASWMGCFEYQKSGFQKQPTDFYYRTFNHVAEKEIGHEKRLNANLCIGNRMNIAVLNDAIQRWAIRMMGKLSFGFFWENSLTHDFLTLPEQGDDNLYEMLLQLDKAGVMEQSIVILMSDHGIRWGGIRSTYQGYVEERLPLLIISVPKWFQRRYPYAHSNLRVNQRRLTSHFDVYSTLLDLLDMTALENSQVLERDRKLASARSLPRGISLFIKVPDTRTCQEASISNAWCMCHQSVEVPTNDSAVIEVAKFLVKHMNKVLLAGYSQCSHLKLDTILGSRLYQTEHAKGKQDSLKDYSIRIQTIPGNGIFEATVRKRSLYEKFNVIGSISRSNLYGNQSNCVSHYRVKLYCYCLSNLEKSPR